MLLRAQVLAITRVFGVTPWPRVDRGGEKMKSPPRLGLGTINIVPFVEGLIYYQSTSLEFRYGDEKVLDTQPHLTCGLTSTHCVPCLNSIKDTLNIVILTSMHLKQANMTYSSLSLIIHPSWH